MEMAEHRARKDVKEEPVLENVVYRGSAKRERGEPCKDWKERISFSIWGRCMRPKGSSRGGVG